MEISGVFIEKPLIHLYLITDLNFWWGSNITARRESESTLR